MAYFLKQVLYTAKENEQAKEKLLMNRNLVVKDLFNHLSSHSSFLSADHLRMYAAEKHSLEFSEEEVQCFFERISEEPAGGDGIQEMNMQQFVGMLTPYSYEYQQLLEEALHR